MRLGSISWGPFAAKSGELISPTHKPKSHPNFRGNDDDIYLYARACTGAWQVHVFRHNVCNRWYESILFWYFSWAKCLCSTENMCFTRAKQRILQQWCCSGRDSHPFKSVSPETSHYLHATRLYLTPVFFSKKRPVSVNSYSAVLMHDRTNFDSVYQQASFQPYMHSSF